MKTIEFRKVEQDKLDDVITGFIHAFPHWKYHDAKEAVIEQIADTSMEFIASYYDDCYAGLSVTADVFHNHRGEIIPAMELDHLHTDLLYKKQRVSIGLLQEATKRSLTKGVAIMFLGPFSTKFYRNLGFGFGLRELSFDSAPADFRDYQSIEGLSYYNAENEESKQTLSNFIYNARLRYQGNISIKQISYSYFMNEKLESKERTTLLYKENDMILGYLTYKNSNEILVDEILYTSPKAMNAFSSYLHRQKGQASTIKIQSCDHGVLMNCDRPQNIQLNEICMVKILDVKMFFAQLQQLESINFNGQTLSLKIKTFDKLFMMENEVVLHFVQGRIMSIDNIQADAEISLEISDFSSMVLGRVTFHDLLRSGLAKLDQAEYSIIINDIFRPECMPLMINAEE